MEGISLFDSEVSAKELIALLKDEVDIAYPIPNASYVSWLNSLEQLLYAYVIREQGEIIIDHSETGVDLSKLSVPTEERALSFDRIHAVYADDVQLMKTTVASGHIFSDCYYMKNNRLQLCTQKSPIRIVYYVVPALKECSSSDEVEGGNVMLPVAFLELAKAKLRSEAYKVANEDELAAKWANEYNVLLEDFKACMAEHAAQFGL